jgi:hypothetical protein
LIAIPSSGVPLRANSTPSPVLLASPAFIRVQFDCYIPSNDTWEPTFKPARTNNTHICLIKSKLSYDGQSASLS